LSRTQEFRERAILWRGWSGRVSRGRTEKREGNGGKRKSIRASPVLLGVSAMTRRKKKLPVFKRRGGGSILGKSKL